MAPVVTSLSCVTGGSSPGSFNPQVVPQTSQADLINCQALSGNVNGALNNELFGAIVAQNEGPQGPQPVQVPKPCPEGEVCIQTNSTPQGQTPPQE